MATTNYMVRLLDASLTEGIIHDAYKRIGKGYSSYPLFEHLLCSKTYVTINLSIDRFVIIMTKILRRYFGEFEITSIGTGYQIIKFDNGVEVHICNFDRHAKSQSMTQFRRELYKVVNTIL